MPATAMAASRRCLVLLLQLPSSGLTTSMCAVVSGEGDVSQISAPTRSRSTFLERPDDSVELLQQELAVVRKASPAGTADEDLSMRPHKPPKKRTSFGEFMLAHVTSDERVASGGMFAIIILIFIFVVLCILGGVLILRSAGSRDGDKDGGNMQNDDLVRAYEPSQRRGRQPHSARLTAATSSANKDCCMGFMAGPTGPGSRVPSLRPESPICRSPKSNVTTAALSVAQQPVPGGSSTAPKGVRFAEGQEVVHYPTDGRRP